MQCPECGYELKPEDLKESNTCPECGTQLPEDFVSLVVNGGDEDNANIKTEELDESELLEEVDEDISAKKGKFSFKFILIIGLLIIIGGASFFFFIKPMLLKKQAENIPDTNLVEEFPFDTSSFEGEDTAEIPFDTSEVDTSSLGAEENVDSVKEDSLNDTSVVKKDTVVNKTETADTNKIKKDTLAVKDTLNTKSVQQDSVKVGKETSNVVPQDTIKKTTVKKISKRKIYRNKKKTITKYKKKVSPKKKIDYTKIYPYKGSIKLQNGKVINDRFKTGMKKLHYITFTSDKEQKISFDVIFKIKFFYEGPIYLSDNSYITKVTATIFLNDGSRIDNIIISRLSLMTMKNGSFLIVNNYKMTKNINSINEIIFKKE